MTGNDNKCFACYVDQKQCWLDNLSKSLALFEWDPKEYCGIKW